jgi:single-strand DNA-binding protein
MLKMRLATTEGYVNREGERAERTDWHTVIVWGKRAESLNKILGKGDRIGVEGRIQTRSYEAKDGTRRWATDIIAANVLLLGGRSNGNGKRIEPETDTLNPPVETLGESDVPF